MKWFRWWHGTTTDPKFGGIATKTGQTRERVLFVWTALCESASENEADRGTYDCDPSDIAATLGCDLAHVEAIIAAFESRAMVAGKRICAWDNRNPARDDAAQRQRTKRDKDTAVTPTARDKRVTVTPEPSDSHSNVRGERKPDTDSDTDTDSEKIPSSLRSDGARARRALVDDEAVLHDPDFKKLAEDCGKSLVDEIPRWRDWQANAPKPNQRSPRDERAQLRNWLRSPFGKDLTNATNRLGAVRPDRPRTPGDAVRANPAFRAASARMVAAAGGRVEPLGIESAAGGPHSGDDREPDDGRRAVPGVPLREAAAGSGGDGASDRGDGGPGDLGDVPAAVRVGGADGPQAIAARQLTPRLMDLEGRPASAAGLAADIPGFLRRSRA